MTEARKHVASLSYAVYKEPLNSNLNYMPAEQSLVSQTLVAFRVPLDFTRILASLKAPFLNPPVPTMIAAKDFTINEAVHAFGLKFHWETVGFPEWRIEAIPETKGFISPSNLRKLFKHSLSNL